MAFSISTVLEVGLGLALIYYVLSLIVSYVTSKIAELLNLRARDLEEGLRDLLEDSGKLQNFLDHPLIKELKPLKAPQLVSGKGIKLGNLTKLWSLKATTIGNLEEIPPEKFALAVLDIVAPGEKQSTAITETRDLIAQLPDGETRKALLSLIDSGVKNLAETRKLIEGWFDDSMAKISALYKQQAKSIAIIVALVVTLVTGVDSLAIAGHLWTEPSSRAAIAAEVDKVIKVEGLKDEETRAYISELDELVEIPILNPVWNLFVSPEARLDPTGWVSKLFGLAITWLAVAQGSSFWYQVLKRIRSATTAPPPEESSGT